MKTIYVKGNTFANQLNYEFEMFMQETSFEQAVTNAFMMAICSYNEEARTNPQYYAGIEGTPHIPLLTKEQYIDPLEKNTLKKILIATDKVFYPYQSWQYRFVNEKLNVFMFEDKYPRPPEIIFQFAFYTEEDLTGHDW